MPSVVPPGHPRVAEVLQMGEAVYRWREKRESLYSVCLVHGYYPAVVQFATIQPMIGLNTLGKPVTVVTVAVQCPDWCGYRLVWRSVT